MTMPIRVVLVEDEEPARDLVKHYLENHPELELVGEFSDGFSGLKGIQELKPDLLILDIQMPKLTGFEILELLESPPVVVFTTAYDEFAIKAFELNATDYLLKPFSRERFDAAMQKAMERAKVPTGQKKAVEDLLRHVEENERLDRVVVKSGSKIKVIPVEKISYIEAQDDYVMIYTDTGKHLKEKTMKYFEAHLDPAVFARLHRSYIARIDQIVQIELYEKDSYVAVLKDGAKLRISENGYRNLKKKLNF